MFYEVFLGMNKNSFRLLRFFHILFLNLVAPEGIAPSRPYGHRFLKPARLLFRHGALFLFLIQWMIKPRRILMLATWAYVIRKPI